MSLRPEYRKLLKVLKSVSEQGVPLEAIADLPHLPVYRHDSFWGFPGSLRVSQIPDDRTSWIWCQSHSCKTLQLDDGSEVKVTKLHSRNRPHQKEAIPRLKLWIFLFLRSPSNLEPYTVTWCVRGKEMFPLQEPPLAVTLPLAPPSPPVLPRSLPDWGPYISFQQINS